MLTSLISPNGMKAECRMASVTESSKPPTYKVVFGLVPCGRGAGEGGSRARDPRGEGRNAQVKGACVDLGDEAQ